MPLLRPALAGFLTAGLLLAHPALSAPPADPVATVLAARTAPPPGRTGLRPGDRLALCGDSITEQRMYSRIIETYLTVCEPDLGISVRQYGWSGEKADGFFARMAQDVLPFQPTVATTCYGMNDHLYRPQEAWITELYRIHLDAVVRSFQDAGVRVVVGSPGPVGKMPSWVRSARGTVSDLNRHLATLRNTGIGIARARGTGFADVFTPMYTAQGAARERYGEEYAVAGSDGVHPDWAGQTLMAYAFLRALGLDGDLGTITVDLRRNRARAADGHSVDAFDAGNITLTSRRYPFCAPEGDPARHDSIRSGMQWVPFDPDLNRLRLVVRGLRTPSCRVTWGTTSRSFNADALRRGINLAAEFPQNPFCDAFARVDAAVAAKQEFETRQIKQEFHGSAGRDDMAGTIRRTEATRDDLVAAIRNAFVPVTHRISLVEE